MAYDNKNAYPKKPQTARRKLVGNQNPASDALKMKQDKEIKNKKVVDKILSRFKSCRSDMESLNAEREKYLKAYLGSKYGDEVEGRAQVVMTDVSNTVEWIMPSLMRIFYGGSDVTELRPRGPEDEIKAELMKEKVNFDIQKDNNGFVVLYTWFKDALMYKMGVVKRYWSEEIKYESEEYDDLSLDQFDGILNDPDFIVEEHSSSSITELDPLMGLEMPVMQSYSVKGRRAIKKGKIVLENVPYDEFIFDVRGKTRADSFIAHKIKKTKQEVQDQYGLSVDEINDYIESVNYDASKQAFYEDLGGISYLTPKLESECVYIYEVYPPESSKFYTVFGETILKEQENKYGVAPFCIITPIIMQHRMIGRTPIELVMDIQKLRTSLARYILDNIYFQNNGMKVVNPYRINLDDLLNNNKPGGIVRTKFDTDPSSAIFPIPTDPLAPQAFQFWDMSEMIRENATGITRYNQGLDSKSLNRTASGISQIMSAAQQRVELIARVFAETGVKELIEDIIDMNVKFFDYGTSIKINEQWQFVRPEDISGRFDVIIDVGIGTGSTELKVNQMMQMLNTYGMIAKVAGPSAPQVFTLDNIKNLIKEIWKAWGYKNTDKFVAPDQPMGGMNGPGNGAGPMGQSVGSGGGGEAAGAPNPLDLLQQNGGGVQMPPMGMPFG